MSGQSNPKFFLAGTQFFGNGGIQRVNRGLLEVFSAGVPGGRMDVEVFSYLDAADAGQVRAAPGCQFYGAAGSAPAFAAQIAWRVLSRQPKLILFTHVRLLRLAGLCRKLSRGVNIGVLCHGAEVWEKSTPEAGRELRGADFIVAPSEHTRSKIASCHGISSERVQVIPHGLPGGWNAPAGEPSVHAGANILCVTRMTRDDLRFGTKGVDALLRGAALLRREFPQLQVDVVGDGDDRARLEDLCRSLGLERHARFWGALPEPQLRQRYQQADIFALLSDMEGFGMVYLEAMAHGLPVVGYRAAATPEVVADGVTGLLSAPGDDAQLTNNLRVLLHSPERRRDMGLQGRERVARGYSFSQFAQRWQRWLEVACAREI